MPNEDQHKDHGSGSPRETDPTTTTQYGLVIIDKSSNTFQTLDQRGLTLEDTQALKDDVWGVMTREDWTTIDKAKAAGGIYAKMPKIEVFYIKREVTEWRKLDGTG